MDNTSFIPKKIAIKETWGQLHGCSLPLALAAFCQEKPGVTLLIAPDHLAARQLKDELQFFLTDGKPSHEILLFPDWETLPYDHFSPHQDIISERLYTLSRLQQGPSHAIAIVAASTLMHRICPPSFLNQHALVLREGQLLLLEPFREQLMNAGYRAVNQVLEHGEFAVRGGLIDVYPMGSAWPYRIERFDDTIDSLRRFDPDNQRTIEKISTIDVLPAREFPLNEASTSQFRRTFRERFSGNPSQCPIYTAISEGRFPNGIE